MFEITDNRLEDHIDRIVTIVQQIRDGHVTVLVGPNGVGKSLVRSQLHLWFYHQTGMRNMVRSISMEDRTGSKPELGAFCSILRDNPETPTSLCTFNLINRICGHLGEKDKGHFYILDEPEIGMGKESRLGIAKYLVSLLPAILENSKGLLIITHSDEIVSQMVNAGADFIWLDYNGVYADYQEWKNREIKPTDFPWLEEWSSRLSKAIQKRQSKNKGKEKP